MGHSAKSRILTARSRFFLGLAIPIIAVFLTTKLPGATALETGLGDPLFRYADPQTRDYWLSKAGEANSRTIMVHIHWREVVSSTAPMNPTNPADPAYDFSSIDSAVRAADSRGFEVILNALHAPAWAEGPDPWPGVQVGAWKPNAAAFGDFAEAVAKRYSGSFHDLPRVVYYEAWNEPNLPWFLAPQRSSGDRYRNLLNNFYEGIKSVSGRNQVIAGATAPYGRETSNRLKRRTRPMVFLRDLFCLTRSGKKKSCPEKARFDILSHHGINTSGNPKIPAISSDDASTADMGRVRTLLRQAERQGTIGPRSARPRPLWVTEFWINSNPPVRRGPSPRLQAQWLQDSLYLFWRQGVSRAVYFLLSDFSTDFDSASGSGLFYRRGKPKPSFRAFRTPLHARRIADGKKVAVWIKRPPKEAVKLQAKGRNGWATVRRFPGGRAIIEVKVRYPRSRYSRGKMRVITQSGGAGVATRVK